MDAGMLVVYCVTVFAVAVTPGPSMALAFAHGARYGVMGTIPTALGNVAASLAQAGAALIALQTVSTIDPRVFAVTQGIGALVLIYIGIGLVRTALRTPITANGPATDAQVHRRRFLTGTIITLFNPKAILFFAALFPQFVSGSAISPAAYAALLLPIGSVAFISFLLYAGFGTLSSTLLGRTRLPTIVMAVVGSLLTATGVVGLVDAVRDLLAGDAASRSAGRA